MTTVARVALRHDVSLAVAEWPGPGKGPAVVCIHGLTANHTCWASVADVLSPAHRLIAYDLRGRGESDKPEHGLQPGAPQRGPAGAARSLRPQEGGAGRATPWALTSRFASRPRHPERVAKLVLVDGGLDVRHEVLESLRPAINRLGVEFPSLDMFLGFVRLLPMFEGRWNDYLERYFRYDVEELPAGTVRAKAARLAIEEEIANLERERALGLSSPDQGAHPHLPGARRAAHPHRLPDDAGGGGGDGPRDPRAQAGGGAGDQPLHVLLGSTRRSKTRTADLPRGGLATASAPSSPPATSPSASAVTSRSTTSRLDVAPSLAQVHHRAQRGGQDHLLQPAERAVPADRGPHPVQGARHHAARGGGPNAARHRPLLPAHQHLPDAHRARERAARGAGAPRARLHRVAATTGASPTSRTRAYGPARDGAARGASGARPAGALAHGEKRKLELGILLALEPEVLLLDEPTAGMSLEEVPAIIELIERIRARRDRTILLVEHKIDMVMALSDSIAVLQDGRLIADGPPAAVSASAAVQAAYFGARACLTCSSWRACTPTSGSTTSSRASPCGCGRDAVTVLLGRNGAGKTTTMRTDHGACCRRSGARCASTGARSTGLAAPRDRAARHRLRAGGAGDLRHPHRGREPAGRHAGRDRGGRERLRRVLELFPDLERFRPRGPAPSRAARSRCSRSRGRSSTRRACS